MLVCSNVELRKPSVHIRVQARLHLRFCNDMLDRSAFERIYSCVVACPTWQQERPQECSRVPAFLAGSCRGLSGPLSTHSYVTSSPHLACQALPPAAFPYHMASSVLACGLLAASSEPLPVSSSLKGSAVRGRGPSLTALHQSIRGTGPLPAAPVAAQPAAAVDDATSPVSA